MTNITKYAVGHRSITWFFLVVMLLGGIYAFDALGKKEDSTFVIKSAIVSCHYPGATPEEVESSIAIPLERELHTSPISARLAPSYTSAMLALL